MGHDAAEIGRPSIVINGRFLCAPATGVQRVAQELTLAIDALGAGSRFELAVPSHTDRRLDLRAIRARAVGGPVQGILWEQVILPAAAGRRLLLNFSNTGPLIKSGAITMMHDAQIYVSPASYSPSFRNFYRLLQPMLGRRHRRILTVSNFSKLELVKYGVAREENIVVIHNGADHVARFARDASVFESLGLEAGAYAVAPSSVQAHKNIGFLLSLFGRAEMRDRRLVLYGAAIRADFLALGMRVPDNILFAGRIDDDQMAVLVERASCFLFPSLTEGFGLPPMEAMMLNCPAIVAPCGALPEICGEGAIYADPTDPAAWRTSIERCSEDAGFAAARREVGRRRACGFTWRRAAELVLKEIEAVGRR